jgi:hypothetical protein
MLNTLDIVGIIGGTMIFTILMISLYMKIKQKPTMKAPPPPSDRFAPSIIFVKEVATDTKPFQTPSSPQSILSADVKTPQELGETICPICGKVNLMSSTFCFECGSSLK